jgi:hypothetical protein
VEVWELIPQPSSVPRLSGARRQADSLRQMKLNSPREKNKQLYILPHSGMSISEITSHPSTRKFQLVLKGVVLKYPDSQ